MTTYGSVCSGIEAASCAWHPLGWRAEWFAEIEPFPSAVLAHHYPGTPNLGDMTLLAAQVLAGTIKAPDVLVGGTPCQAFSVAGMRAGLDDPRGALTIKYVELADAVDHVRSTRGDDECIVVWENVPGVLSDKGNAFGCFLGALVGESDALLPAGGKWTDAGCVYGPRRTAAWRVLDAQYFGLAQRRRRVFVVASARAGFDPAAVLFEREGVRRDTPPRRGQGQDIAGRAPFGPALQCGCGYLFGESLGEYGCPNCEGDEGPAVSVIAGVPAFGSAKLDGSLFQAGTLTANGARGDFESETFCVTPLRAQHNSSLRHDTDAYVVGTLQAGGKAAGSATQQDAESGLLAVHGTQDPVVQVDQAHTLGRNHGQENAIFAIQNATRGKDQNGLGIAADSPMYTLDQASQHAVCVTGDITHTLKADGFDGSEDGTGHGQSSAPVLSFKAGQSEAAGGVFVTEEYAPTLQAQNNGSTATPSVMVGSAVRRLTPRECERLQGFPDDYTLIPWRGKPEDECPDGPRYKAIGNSKAVPVVRWIGRRIQQEIA